MDLTTKWLIRIASVIIILFAITITVAVPVIAFKISNQIETLQSLVSNLKSNFPEIIKLIYS